MLILGHDLQAFLQMRRKRNKKTYKPGELYCVRCRAPKLAGGGMVDYSPITEKFGNLIAICPDCDSIMNRRVSLANLAQVCGNMDISYPQAQQHIVESTNPTVNSDLK